MVILMPLENVGVICSFWFSFKLERIAIIYKYSDKINREQYLQIVCEANENLQEPNFPWKL